MSRIYKKSHVTHSESLSGIAFGGGGGGGGGGGDRGRGGRPRGNVGYHGQQSTGGLTNNGKAALCAGAVVGAAVVSGTGVGAVAGRIASGALGTALCGDVDWSKVK